MCLVNAMENVTERTGASGKPEYERKQQVMTILLVKIPEIKVKIGHDGRSSFANSHDVLDDGGTGEESGSEGSMRGTTNQMTLFPDPATQIGVCEKVRRLKDGERNARFP